MADFDLLLIGGGINGAGIARDAAGRGLRVLLVEQNDLASGTSSASTKLIHGGLRYLEHGSLRLVRESLIEREVLLRNAPHLIRPMRFVLPHHAGLRPAWLLQIGLLIYDHLGGRRLLPRSRKIELTGAVAGEPLQPHYRQAFEYSDCWVDDSRLVVLNALDAAERGATIRTRTQCIGAARQGDHWRATLTTGGRRETVTARILVNAAGPWVARVNEQVLGLPTRAPVRLVKGSHIVVPRLWDHDRAYTFQSGDGRVVFAIPYEQHYTLLGTTDVDFTGDPAVASATPQEIAYLCEVASGYFRAALTPDHVIWSFAGVRPLYDDGASSATDATRDYVLEVDGDAGEAARLTVYGGKITTYRRLAEAALAKLARFLPGSRPWTQGVPLPGGDLAWDGAAALAQRARVRWPFLDAAQALRLTRAYGTRVDRVLADAAPDAVFGGLLYHAEVRYLMRSEWAVECADVLWRRTKLGLALRPAEVAALTDFMRRESALQAAG